MSGKQLAVQTAGAALVRDTKTPDRVFLVNFEQEAYLDVQFTNDIQKLELGLKRSGSGGSTAMRDAIFKSIDYL